MIFFHFLLTKLFVSSRGGFQHFVVVLVYACNVGVSPPVQSKPEGLLGLD